ncbi:unnamed protein product [Absidia cylindrospora]
MAEKNSEFAIVPSGSNGIFINGGTGTANGKPLQYQSAIYNAATNTWNNLVASNTTNSLAQAKGASGSIDTLGKGDAAYIWGGVMDASIGSANTTYSGTFLVMNPMTGSWSPSLAKGAATCTLGYTPRIGHTTLSSYSTVSIFGGEQARYDSASNTYKLEPASFYEIPQFNTILLQWKLADVSGDIPSPRSYHTTTTFSSLSMVLYGGAVPGTPTPVSDTLYKATMLTGSVKWTRIRDTGGGPGPRFGHSAVTLGYNTLLVIGGIDNTGVVQQDVNVYSDYSNVWRTSYSSSGIYSSNSNNGGSSGSESGTSGSSGSSSYGYGGYGLTFALQQAIAGGISAGGLVFFGLIGAALSMVIRKHDRTTEATAVGAIDHHPMDDMLLANGYAKVELDASAVPDDRPLPPPPPGQQSTQVGEAASYLQQHPSSAPGIGNYHQPHPY